jgi:hypothetical protein
VLGNLRERHPAEIAQFDELCFDRVVGGETLQGFVKSEQLIIGGAGFKSIEIGGPALQLAAALLTGSPARLFDQDAPPAPKK